MRSKLGVLPWVVLLLPLDLIVAIGLLFAHLCTLIFPSSQRRGGAQRRGGQFGGNPTAAIVIVNWDGKHLLAECLPSVVDAVNYAGGSHEILIVDNGSTDGSVEFLQKHFPQVRVLPLDHNYGFGGGNNRAVGDLRTDIVVFLNNDMIVHRDFLPPLLEGFKDRSIFAITSQIFFADPTRRRQETGKTRARFERGFFYFWHDPIHPSEENVQTIPVFWAGGGSCAVDRQKFLAIGGFDSLYSPFYVEDTDISYQAWKRGWKCLLAPASRVVHKHRATSKARFGDQFVDNTIRKNTYLFTWKNLTDASLLFEHLFNLPRVHIRGMVENGAYSEFRAFIRAVVQLPKALIKRLSNSPHYVISDRDILSGAQNPQGL